ncbi:hypothetical protein L6452_12735 [Arctium lappa]|uniref:Uncharacterized protein n=1 Tax=Arctium lappa TaxID=4217 RepID=A0ACB9DRP6_ARCLA|nr:hypothetical protein L6452_12735 [Arctium lappa]
MSKSLSLSLSICVCVCDCVCVVLNQRVNTGESSSLLHTYQYHNKNCRQRDAYSSQNEEENHAFVDRLRILF